LPGTSSGQRRWSAMLICALEKRPRQPETIRRTAPATPLRLNRRSAMAAQRDAYCFSSMTRNESFGELGALFHVGERILV
jgi:hypothetical protein